MRINAGSRLAAGAVCLWLTGCSGGSGGGAPTVMVMPPAASVPPRGAQAFTVAGGAAPYTFTLAGNASGGGIDASGHYTAGGKGGVTDVVSVKDAAGLAATVPITVGAGVVLDPATAVLPPLGRRTFTAAGGSGAGYVFSLAATAAGRIDARTGVYTAPTAGPADDTIDCSDSLGNHASATLHVSGPLTVTPGFSDVQAGDAIDFTVSGGGSALTFSLSSAPSGGTIDGSGHYVAGSASGSDVIRVTDASGDAGEAAVYVLGSPSLGFPIGAHKNQHVDPQGGPTLDRPVMVTITWAGDPHRKDAEKFGDFLVGSDWLAQVGAEYGVTAAYHDIVELADPAPGDLTDADVQAYVAGWIADGTVPSNVGTQTLYFVEIPVTSTLSSGGVGLCTFSGGGYHGEGMANDGTTFSYAVVSACREQGSTPLQVLQLATAHELIEAITDPLPFSAQGYRLAADQLDPWYQVGGELGDLCAYAPAITVSGFTLPVVFSNAAAALRASPCVPSSGTYFTVGAEPSDLQQVNAGDSVIFTLTGWSTGPVAPWQVYAAPYGAQCCSYFTPDLNLAASSLGNGQKTTLTVTVPADTPSGSGVLVFIGSYVDQAATTGALVGVLVN